MKKTILIAGIVVLGLAISNICLFDLNLNSSQKNIAVQNIETLSASASEIGCDGENQNDCVMTINHSDGSTTTLHGKGDKYWSKN